MRGEECDAHKLYMLESALKSSYESILNCIIQLITLNGGIEESEIMVRSIKSHHPKIRAAAYETLEKIAPTTLFSMIEPFLNEQMTTEHRLQLFLKQGGTPLALSKLLQVLLNSPNATEQTIALNVKKEFLLKK